MTNSTILFVCTGNTCRSPLAEGIAQQWLEDHGHTDWMAVSAGTFAIKGSQPSEETINALSQRGIVYSGTTTPLTREMVCSANAVVCMSDSHLSIAKQYAENPSSVRLLDPTGSINDPVGQDQSVYDVLADKMEQLISQLLKTMVQHKEGSC